MWKFKELYEAVQKRFQSDLNLIPKDYKEPEFKLPVHKDPTIWRRYEQGGAWNMIDEYGDIDIPKNASTHSVQTSASTSALEVIENLNRIANEIGEPGIFEHQAIYAQCDKHENGTKTNVLFYDTRVYDECPQCKEEREKLGEFLSESDMQL